MVKLTVLLTFLAVLTGQSAFAYVAFQKQAGDLRSIVVAEDDGSRQQRISNLNFDTYHPDISSDGRYVAYSRGTIRPGLEVNVELVVRSLDEARVEVWSSKGNQYIHAEFSGNDRFLAYSGMNPRNGKQNIHLIDLKKERLESSFEVSVIYGELTYFYNAKPEIIESNYDCYAPALASDASFIIYHRTLDKSDKRAPKQLMLFDRGTKDFKKITEEGKHAMFPSLSMDERYVTYVSKDSGQWDIYLYDLWNGEKSAVTSDANIEFTPVFAPDNSIYFTRFAEDESGENLIDIYHIAKDQVFNPDTLVKPKPFLNDPLAAEYVPSFSNPNNLKIKSLADLLSPERSSFGAVFHDNKIYIAGGHQGPGHVYPKESFLNKLEVYDLETQVWQSLAPMNTAKHGFQMVAQGDHLYVFGGFAYSEKHLPAWKSLDSIERYDIKTNRWTTLKTKLSVPRSSNAVAKVGNTVYLLGGWNSTPKFKNDKEGLFLESIDGFNLESETAFVSEFKIPQPLRRAMTAVVVKNEIYLLGGIGEGASHFEWVDNVTALNPKTKKWRELPPLPFATFAPGVGQIDGDLYLVGGMILKNSATYDLNYVDDVYKFNQKDQTWSHTGVFLNKNKGFPQVVSIPGHTLGVLGGHTYEYTSDGGIIDHPVKSFEAISL